MIERLSITWNSRRTLGLVGLVGLVERAPDALARRDELVSRDLIDEEEVLLPVELVEVGEGHREEVRAARGVPPGLRPRRLRSGRSERVLEVGHEQRELEEQSPQDARSDPAPGLRRLGSKRVVEGGSERALHRPAGARDRLP